MLLCAALPVGAADTPADNPSAALPAITITTPITFTMLATSQNGVNYPPVQQQQGGRYIIPVQPQQPYQRACGTTATDACDHTAGRNGRTGLPAGESGIGQTPIGPAARVYQEVR